MRLRPISSADCKQLRGLVFRRHGHEHRKKDRRPEARCGARASFGYISGQLREVQLFLHNNADTRLTSLEGKVENGRQNPLSSGLRFCEFQAVLDALEPSFDPIDATGHGGILLLKDAHSSFDLRRSSATRSSFSSSLRSKTSTMLSGCRRCCKVIGTVRHAQMVSVGPGKGSTPAVPPPAATSQLCARAPHLPTLVQDPRRHFLMKGGLALITLRQRRCVEVADRNLRRDNARRS